VLPHGFVMALATLVTVAACSSRQGSSAAAAPTPEPAAVVITDERDAALSAALGQRVISGDPTVGEPVDAAPDMVYRALVTVYQNLGIAPTLVNPNTRLVASLERRYFGRFGGSNLSAFISCGESMTGARANQDRVVMSVISRVKPNGTDKSRVETRIVAVATGAGGGTSSDRQPCNTTGELELRIHRATKATLGV
jgi:hypothetical protein